MLKILKFAAIDIGSNAVRLLIENIYEVGNKPEFKKQSLVRVPLRLGFDSFDSGEISEVRSEKLIKTMIAFKNLMDAHDVTDYRACATSALREATNGPDLIKEIKIRSGIDIEIIDGEIEAALIGNTHFEEFMNADENYLYVDVGGGSTEVSVFSKGQKLLSKSFQLGTIRILKKQDKPEEWEHLKSWLQSKSELYKPLSVVGSGGNINRMYRIANKTNYAPLHRSTIKSIMEKLEDLSYEERIIQYKLNPDRADVIIPAGKIFLFIMSALDIKHVHVPKSGLADGIVRDLYQKNKKN